MEEEISVDASTKIPTTHFFVYKEKQYPFNFDLFKIFSQFFNSNLPEEVNISLFDENLDLSEGSIPDFINFCQARKIILTKENAPTLHKLSQKFKVPSLLSITKEFISKHQKEVVVEIMLMYRNDDNFNIDEYEEIMANDLVKYVHDDRLFTFPIPLLHRILTRYLHKYKNGNNSNNSEQPPELIEFLFKCLDHFGREASVLFDQIDSFGSSGTLINRLLDGYSEIFDFSFVNKNSLKTVYQLENEIITREKEIKKQISSCQQEVIGISKHVREQIELMRKQRQDEVNDRKEMFEQIPKMVAQEIEELRKQHQEEMKKKDEMMSNMLKQFEAIQAKYQEEIRKQREDFDERMKKANDQPENPKSPEIRRLFTGDKAGLISLLGDDVVLSAANEYRDCYVSNLRTYNDDRFYNFCNATSESASIIKFDFGPYKRVDLNSYFMRTGKDDPKGDHPKTWRIEGSNDNQSWTKLEYRSNDENLDGELKEHHFFCQFSNYKSKSNLFRYIRYVQEDSCNSNSARKYIVELTYFELFGNVVTI